MMKLLIKSLLIAFMVLFTNGHQILGVQMAPLQTAANNGKYILVEVPDQDLKR